MTFETPCTFPKILLIEHSNQYVKFTLVHKSQTLFTVVIATLANFMPYLMKLIKFFGQSYLLCSSRSTRFSLFLILWPKITVRPVKLEVLTNTNTWPIDQPIATVRWTRVHKWEAVATISDLNLWNWPTRCESNQIYTILTFTGGNR